MGKGRSPRSRRILIGAAVAGLVGVAGLVPLALLSTLGEGRDAASADQPSPSQNAAPLPDAAEVVCDDGGTQVRTPRIRPQADGVHFRIDNRTGKHLAFLFRFGDGQRGGDNAAVGRSEVTRGDVPPGTVMVTCWDSRGPASIPKDPSEFVALQVVDQDGIWTSPELDCIRDRFVTGIRDYVSGAKGQRDDPIDLTREHFKGLRSTDVVRQAGYPAQPSPVIAIVREGRTIATASYDADGSGGWLLSIVSRCQDSGLIG